MSSERTGKYALALFAFALVLRVWGLGDMEGHIGDEGHMVPAAQNFVERGHFRPDPWVHPPVAYFVVYGMMNLWGDNEYGWRMGNVLIGSLAVLFLVLLAQELFSDPRIAVLGGLFMTIEPFQITLSRTIPGEIPALFFFIVACYITVRYAKGKVRSPVAAGIFLGLSLASKWYYLLLVPVLILLAWQNDRKAERWIKALHVLSVFVVLPAGIYLLTYYPWFGRGYGVPDFVAMQVDIYREQQALTLDAFTSPYLRMTPTAPREWFIKPLLSAILLSTEGGVGRFFVFMSNFPVWLLALPAFVYGAYLAGKDRDRLKIVALLLFAVSYGQFFMIDRPLFLYSSVVVMPFAYLVIASFIVSMLTLFKEHVLYYRIVLAAVLVWGLYLYPFVVGRPVPTDLYAPLMVFGTFH